MPSFFTAATLHGESAMNTAISALVALMVLPVTSWTAVAQPKEQQVLYARDANKIVIDMLVAYTPRAADSYADIEKDLVDLATEEANQSFRLSNLGGISLRVVHAFQTNYVEDGSYVDHVQRLTDKADGYMDEVHGLRDKHRADVVILVVDDPKSCGIARQVRANADEAFAVVHHECATTSYTLAYVIGQLIGARQELAYANGTTWRDIMGSRETCAGCPRIPVWSSPTVLVKGEPAGTFKRDNAGFIAREAQRVAGFR